MEVTRRGGPSAWAMAEIWEWMAQGCELRVLDAPEGDRRRGLSYVTDGRVPRIVTRDEASELVRSAAIRHVGGSGIWDRYRSADPRVPRPSNRC